METDSNFVSSSSLRLSPPCSLMEVFINNTNSITFPCFSCSGFSSVTDYQNDFCKRLAEAIPNAIVLPTADCVDIAEQVLSSVVLPDNDSDERLSLRIVVQNINGVIRAFGEEKNVLQTRRCTMESVIEMFEARDKLECLEGDKAEKDWKESGCNGHHDCSICIQDIESVWDSLKLPCSHVFHEECVMRWLDDNHTCPLCRFELPLKADPIKPK